MKVIEIRQTSRGEVAYLWDGLKVIKTFVEDYTNPNKRASDDNYVEEYEEVEVEPVPMPVARVNTVKVPVRPQKARQPVLEMDEDGLPKLERSGPPKPSMIPPGMRGLFIEHDQPGAAVEKRKV